MTEHLQLFLSCGNRMSLLSSPPAAGSMKLRSSYCLLIWNFFIPAAMHFCKKRSFSFVQNYTLERRKLKLKLTDWKMQKHRLNEIFACCSWIDIVLLLHRRRLEEHVCYWRNERSNARNTNPKKLAEVTYWCWKSIWGADKRSCCCHYY
jgi:hypothetical protein